MVGLALERLAEDAVNLSARRQQFIPLTIAHLGNTGTPTDGFDQMFLQAATHADTADAVGKSFDPDLAAAGFVPGQIAAATLGPTAQDYIAFSGIDPAAIGTQPPAPTGGGGTGGGGGVPATQNAERDLHISRYPPWKDPWGCMEEGGGRCGPGI